jgi:hypothetical protein
MVSSKKGPAPRPSSSSGLSGKAILLGVVAAIVSIRTGEHGGRSDEQQAWFGLSALTRNRRAALLHSRPNRPQLPAALSCTRHTSTPPARSDML